MKVIWTDFAKNSLLDIVHYLSCYFDSRVVRKAVNEIRLATKPLAKMHELGFPLPEYSKYGNVRCLVHKQNRIIYMVIDNSVQILVVWDGRKDPNALQDMMLEHFYRLSKDQ